MRSAGWFFCCTQRTTLGRNPNFYLPWEALKFFRPALSRYLLYCGGLEQSCRIADVGLHILRAPPAPRRAGLAQLPCHLAPPEPRLPLQLGLGDPRNWPGPVLPGGSRRPGPGNTRGQGWRMAPALLLMLLAPQALGAGYSPCMVVTAGSQRA